MEEKVKMCAAAEAAAQKTSLFLTQINIRKVRHLHDIVIPLSEIEKRNLVLTGENGSGKSSVLEALYFTLREHLTRGQLQDNLDLSVSYSSSVYDLWKLSELYDSNLFLIIKFDDERKMEGTAEMNREDSPLTIAVKLQRLLQSQILKRGVPGSKESVKRAGEVDVWFNRFRNVLRNLYSDDNLDIDFNSETSKFAIYATNKEPFDFNTMASGFSAVFDVIADILMRMEEASPGNYDLPGIVLIDEIEVHLHVSLQKKILPILTELFPNLQFIVTTHSPFVLASAKNAVVYDLEHRILAADGLSNVPYSGIVEGYFRVDEMSEKLENSLETYRALASKKEWTDADYAEAARLEMELDKVPDFLAAGWKAEYTRLKLEIAADKGE